PADEHLNSVQLTNGIVTARYANATVIELRLWPKCLVCHVINRTTQATELSFGQVTGVAQPRTVWIPFLTYGGGAHPSVLLSENGSNHLLTSIWLDWYRSNGSEPYAAESTGTHSARINGGVRYRSRT